MFGSESVAEAYFEVAAGFVSFYFDGLPGLGQFLLVYDIAVQQVVHLQF